MIHTKEPCVAGIIGDSIYKKENGVVSVIAREIKGDDARRIVACVNACAGIPTVSLEGVKDDVTPMFELLLQISAQRDELLAICRNVVERGIGVSDIRAMEEAIAKVEAK